MAKPKLWLGLSAVGVLVTSVLLAGRQLAGDYAGLINDPMKALYWGMTIEYGMMYSKMHREWLENCIRRLEELKYEATDN